MKPKINKTSEYIEIVGHYDDSVLCAKLTLLADLYAIEHKEGYAKFRIEDEDKLRLVDDRLEFGREPEPVAYNYNDYLEIINESFERVHTIISLDTSLEHVVYFEENSSELNSHAQHDSTVRGIYRYTISGDSLQLEFDLSNYDGLSTTSGATTSNITDGAQLDNYFSFGQIQSDADWTYDSSRTNYLYAVPKASNIVSDLTGTKWLLNSSLNLSSTSYEINFVSNDSDYAYFAIGTAPSSKDPIAYELAYFTYSSSIGNAVYEGYSAEWSSQVYRTIEITGGTDATNSTLISWLQNNATQVIEPTETNTFSIGSLSVANVYFGLLQVNKIYLGNSLVWENAAEENALLAQDGALLTSDGGYLITTEVTLISFTIGGTTYQAEQSMTWGEWVNSTYNIVNYRVQYDNIYTSTGQTRVYNGSQIVSSSDTILANTAYSLVIMGMED